MKKALKTKFSGSKNLVRRVLSKSSNSTHEPASQNLEISMNEEAILANEIGALKDQIANLKAAINALQEETEHKEIAIAKLARDKEKLNLDLLKQRRSNNNLIQQLEDERKFYFQEKEVYCQEMNECKKLKRLMSTPSVNGEEKTVSEYKNEVLKLKQTLNQTLEANYNLSIKFLRMKNTKTCLKTELKTMKLEHEKLENDYKIKIENLSSELSDLVNDKWSTPMSPSSKKYLQLVKQNSCLVYENLCLQLEVDNLNLKFEKLKLERTKSETNDRLKYIHHDKPEHEHEKHHKKKSHKEPKHVRIKDEPPEKLEKEPKPSCSRNRSPIRNEKIVKIFERVELPGVPDIKIINEKEIRTKEKKVKKKLENIDSKHDHNRPNVKKSISRKEDLNIPSDYQLKIDDSCRKQFLNKDSSKLALFQVSDMQSITSSDYVSITPSIKRSRSSPEIIQSSLFKKASLG